MAFAFDSKVRGYYVYIKMFGVLEWIPSYHALQSLQQRRLVRHYTRTLQHTEILT